MPSESGRRVQGRRRQVGRRAAAGGIDGQVVDGNRRGSSGGVVVLPIQVNTFQSNKRRIR